MILLLIPFVIFILYLIHYFDGFKLINNLKNLTINAKWLTNNTQYAETKESDYVEPNYETHLAYTEKRVKDAGPIESSETTTVSNSKEEVEDKTDKLQPVTTPQLKHTEVSHIIKSAEANDESLNDWNQDGLNTKNNVYLASKINSKSIDKTFQKEIETSINHYDIPNLLSDSPEIFSPISSESFTDQIKSDSSQHSVINQTNNFEENNIEQDKTIKLESSFQSQDDLKQHSSKDHNPPQISKPESADYPNQFDKAYNSLDQTSIKSSYQTYKSTPEPEANANNCNESIKPDFNIDRHLKALELKNQGNEAFKSNKYTEALHLYSEAIKTSSLDDSEFRSTIFCNQAACYQKLSNWEQVLAVCNKSLALNPRNIKAHIRRLSGFENLEKWIDADQAITSLIELDPSLKDYYYSKQQRIKQAASELEKKIKEEAMEQFKSLGNSVLGYFGMSINDFKVKQNEQGSYNIEFANKN